MLSPSLATSVDWTVPDGAELKLSTVMEALTYNHVDDAENPGDTIVVDSNGWKVGIKTRPSMNCFSSQDQQWCHDWMSRAWTSVLWFRCWNSVLLLSPTGGSGTPRDLWCKTDRRYMFSTAEDQTTCYNHLRIYMLYAPIKVDFVVLLSPQETAIVHWQESKISIPVLKWI